MRSSMLAALTIALAAACGDPAASDCTVTITDTDVEGNTMTADGTFVTAQPLLVLMMGAMRQVIPGTDDGRGHAIFDLTNLGPGTWDYSFDASCFDANDEPHVDAPTGFFTR